MADNITLVQAAYDGFAEGDVAPLAGILRDDVEWHEAEHTTYWRGEPYHGPKEVFDDVIGRLPRDFDGFRIEVKRMLASGDTVVVEARYHAVGKATGKTLDAQVVHVWDFEGGQLVRWQQYTDTWQWADVTGVQPRAEA